MSLIKGGFSHRLASKLPVWQRSYTDHRIRDRTDFEIRLNYIHQNPVRARLAPTPDAYPFFSAQRTWRYTPIMALTLDPQTEQRIQRLLERGHYESADQIINLALDPFEPVEEWLQRNQEALNEGLEESFAQSRRGEFHTPEEVRRLLADDRASRVR